MRSIAAIVLLLLVHACKTNDVTTVPDELVGKWRMTSRQINQNGTVEWEDVPEKDSIYIFFSHYGEYVDSEGYVLPCGPTSLNINSKFYKINFHSELSNSIYLGLCAECPTWDLELKQANLVVDRCSSDSKMIFVKAD